MSEVVIHVRPTRRRVREMSAVPLIATDLMTRGSPSLGANSRPEQVQQYSVQKLGLLEQLVGAAGQGERNSNAKRFGGLKVDK